MHRLLLIGALVYSSDGQWLHRGNAVTTFLCVDACSIFQFRLGVSWPHAEVVAIAARLKWRTRLWAHWRSPLSSMIRGTSGRGREI